MATTSILIYPPTIDTYTESFTIDSDNENICRIYFSVAVYGNITNVKNVQISFKNLNTNLSALSSSLYPSEIKVMNYKTDAETGEYYVEVSEKDIEGGKFLINQYYKIQLRLTDTSATTLGSDLDAWLTLNENKFSEWSKASLVIGTSEPSIDFSTPSSINWNLANKNSKATFSFKDEAEKGTVAQYSIVLYNNDNEIVSSKDYTTNNLDNPNILYYNFDYNFQTEEDKNYYFILSYETNNLFSGSATCYFKVNQAETPSDVTVKAIADSENGRSIISIMRSETTNFTGVFSLQRTDSSTDFYRWEEIKRIKLTDVQKIKRTIYDYTIESGVFYKYMIQPIDENGDYGAAALSKNTIITMCEDMMMISNDRILRIKFNPLYNSLKTTYNEVKTDSISSKFPIIEKTSNVKYRQISIGGLIAYDMDDNNLFFNEDENLGSDSKYYKKYNKANGSEEYDNYIRESRFKKEVVDFLNTTSPKLLKTETEGNILLYLTTIAFQPNSQVGRRLMSFTATGYEIDECNIDNYKKFNIINIEEVEI